MNALPEVAHGYSAGRTTASQAYRDAVLVPLFQGAKGHAGYYARIDRAYAVMLIEQGILGAAEGARLLRGLAEIDQQDALDDRADAGPYEDLFYLREAALRAVVDSDLAGRLHTGRSRNDIEATVFRLQLKDRLGKVLQALQVCVDDIIELAGRERGTLILAYTHGQPAQPSTYGHYLMAFAEVLLRDLGRLQAAYVDLDACPLGAGAITTTGFPIDRERLAALLGFAQVQDNAYGCIAAVDQFAAAQAALQLLFINLGRWVQDMAFWTAFEVGQARASDGFVQISSIMPQKRNPLAIEHMRVMASLGAGHCQTAIGALHNTPFADMVDAEGPTQTAGLASFEMAMRLLPLLQAFVAELRIDARRVRENIDRSCAAMTELADSLVRMEGLPFRTAHEIAAELSLLLMQRGRGLGTLLGQEVAEAFARHAGRPAQLDADELQRLCQPEHFVAVRDRTGGPGAHAIAASLARARQACRHADERQRHAAARREAAAVLLAAAVQRCLAG